jgi:hypothetical protein
MTVLEVTRTQIKPATGELIKKLTNNRCCLSLLRFFMQHPNGHFSKLAVVHALDDSGRQSEVDNALRQLVMEGVINTRTENAVCFYQLTQDEPQRHVLLSLAKFDWHQWQMVLELL